MSESEFSLVKVDEINLVKSGPSTKAGQALLRVVTEALAGCFAWPIVAGAKAQAERKVILAKADAEAKRIASSAPDLVQRAAGRFLSEQVDQQLNIESVAAKAICYVDEKDASPEKIQGLDKDWVVDFFSKCRNVSDEEMQDLWARTLAGKANSPSSFSKQLVRILADLEGEDAEMFQHFCGFCFRVQMGHGNPEIVPFMFYPHNPIYYKNHLTLDSILHLESLGLLRYDSGSSPSTFAIHQDGCEVAELIYFDRTASKAIPKCTIPVGRVFLTQAGTELASICDASPVDGYFDYVLGELHILPPSPSAGPTPEP